MAATTTTMKRMKATKRTREMICREAETTLRMIPAVRVPSVRYPVASASRFTEFPQDQEKKETRGTNHPTRERMRTFVALGCSALKG